jgi:hypothetical protein
MLLGMIHLVFPPPIPLLVKTIAYLLKLPMNDKSSG